MQIPEGYRPAVDVSTNEEIVGDVFRKGFDAVCNAVVEKINAHEGNARLFVSMTGGIPLNVEIFRRIIESGIPLGKLEVIAVGKDDENQKHIAALSGFASTDPKSVYKVVPLSSQDLLDDKVNIHVDDIIDRGSDREFIRAAVGTQRLISYTPIIKAQSAHPQPGNVYDLSTKESVRLHEPRVRFANLHEADCIESDADIYYFFEGNNDWYLCGFGMDRGNKDVLKDLRDASFEQALERLATAVLYRPDDGLIRDEVDLDYVQYMIENSLYSHEQYNVITSDMLNALVRIQLHPRHDGRMKLFVRILHGIYNNQHVENDVMFDHEFYKQARSQDR